MSGDRSLRWWTVTAVAAAIALIAALVALLRPRGGTEEVVSAGPTVEVLREPNDTAGPDAFSEVSLAASTTAFPPIPSLDEQKPVATVAPTRGEPLVPGVSEEIAGGEPGLYGGTRDQARCDIDQLVTFLGKNPDKATAWIGALNADPTLGWKSGASLTAADIPAYVATLTPVMLMRDTRVTNHGFKDGRATARQSVLQAGTAVLVDVRGVPRTKCPCGNPLLPPARTTTASTPTFTGPTWPGFSPTKQGVVRPATRDVTSFVLIRLDAPGTIERPAGTRGELDVVVAAEVTTPTTAAGAGQPTTPPVATPPPSRASASTTVAPTAPPTAPPTAAPTAPPQTPPTLTVPPSISLGTGDVQATLLWTGDADLDLHVIDPEGVEITFINPSSPSGGKLDVDQVPACGDTSTHVENVFWPTGAAPKGTYKVFAYGFIDCGSPGAFQLTVTVNGAVVASTSGSLSVGQQSETLSVTVG